MRLIAKQLNDIFDQWATSISLSGAIVELPSIFNKMETYIETSFTPAEKDCLVTVVNPKRRASRIAGRFAVRKALSKFSPSVFDENDYESTEIFNDANGKPYLTKHKNLNISISHSGTIAVAVVSTHTIGVDIEKTEERPECFTRSFFNPSEQQWINHQCTNRHQRTNILWTRKEAVSKLLGIGGKASFKEIPVLDHESTVTLHSHTCNHYTISLALMPERLS